jgi:hypothetical protein
MSNSQVVEVPIDRVAYLRVLFANAAAERVEVEQLRIEALDLVMRARSHAAAARRTVSLGIALLKDPPETMPSMVHDERATGPSCT